MAQASKVIITCAITGSIHTPSMSPYLPVTPAEIAASAIQAAAAGAAVVHLHARDPVTGMPSQDAGLFAQFLPQIKAESDVVINLTTGGAPAMTVEERLMPALRFKPEVASLNMGSMNFGMYEMLGRFKEFRHDWERPYLEASEDRIFRNTFKDIAHILAACNDNGTRFEIECYDIGHLYTAAHFMDRGLLKAPVFIQSVFGIRGGIGVHPEDIAHMKRTADRLFGADYHWSALGAGAQQPRVLTQALLLGGNVRVGLEDNLWLRKGQLAKSNAEQVTAIRCVVEQLGFEIATPDEARVMLRLKGPGEVAF
ncbi:3-keto-5-aminohexanoate cleavage protein [Paraburkholderia sp. MM6662-R1]|uniref:3-keto-5-aminohexanoate cleavage protein n=1 Tax=Paraburkholderia sp. MM6662-R1 TaxID=2991066 RepID=UPI003D1D9DF6